MSMIKILKNHQIVGVCLFSTSESLYFVLTLIKLGIKTIFCSSKDPVVEIEKYLQSQGATALFVSDDKQKSKVIPSYVITDFTHDDLSNLADKSTYFSSVIKTSGTSNLAKNIHLTYAHHIKSAQAVSDYFALSARDCFLLNLPLHHVSGLSIVFRSLVSKCSVKFATDYQELKSCLMQNNVTHISLVPFLLNKLLDDNVDLSYLKAVFVGGDTIAKSLVAKALKLKVALYESYGLTEMASSVFIKDYQKSNFFQPLNHVDYKIVNQELLVKMSIDDNFIATGDLFTTSKNGLSFVGRKKNIIVSAGVNIYPEEIEYHINSHPEVLLSVVVPIPDKIYGQRLVAFIKWQHSNFDNELKLYLQTKIASFKIPQKFYVWPSELSDYSKIPRTYFYQLLN